MDIEQKKQMSNVDLAKSENTPESKGPSMGDVLYSDSWLNIVFKGRNTEYGAYSIRQQYARNITIGFLIAFSIFVFAAASPLIFNKKEEKKVKVISMSKPLPKPKDLDQKKKALPPPPPTPPPPTIKTIKVLPPKVEPDDKVQEDPPTNKEMQNTAIGDKNQDGANDPNANVTETSTELPPTDNTPPPPPPPPPIELIVDEKPKPPVDHNQFFRDNFNQPRLAKANGVGGKFKVKLTIETDGSVSDIKVIDLKKVDIIDASTGETYGFVKEIERVVKEMNKKGTWSPGKKGGKSVRSFAQFDLDFRVEQ